MEEKLSDKKFREILRKYYWIETQIARKNNDARINPYHICDWINFFTPIESNVWHDIRVIGTSMWPQYPILNYFVDFADPIRKIIIEVDGKDWHKDKEKDSKRQREIEEYGWKFFRIEGKDTFDDYNSCYDNCDWEDEDDVERCNRKFEQCSEYIIKNIRDKYYRVGSHNLNNEKKEMFKTKTMADIIDTILKEEKTRDELEDYYDKNRPIITS